MTTTHADTAVAGGRVTLQTLREKKKRREPIAMLTAYDYPTAKILGRAGVDLILVGDSAATTVLGAESTVAATLEFMLTITGAVRRGAPEVFLMADMPFGSYPDVPAAEAKRIVETAVAMAKAGALMILLEAVPDEVTAEVQREVAGLGDIVVLGCGAGASADGHVVVVNDMLGYGERVPRFVEKYGDVPAAVEAAARRYVAAVRGREYPAARHGYRMKAE